jgi:Ca2+/H+ antiporter, TMEM165/GDT1 family
VARDRPEIPIDQARKLLASIDTTPIVGLRDRAILAMLIYTGSCRGAVAKLKRGNFYNAGQQWMIHFGEKGGKPREIPVRHDLEKMITEYLDAAGLRDAHKDTPLFQTALRKERKLTGKAIQGGNIYRMMKRRLKDFEMPLLYPPTPSASPPSPICLGKTSRARTCSTWQATPTRAPPICTTAERGRSVGILSRGFPYRRRKIMIDWAHAGPTVLASFLASLVEFAEALTIVLAVGTVRGWRAAMSGTLTGVAFLTLLVLGLGSTLQRIPITTLQLIVGVLLLLFGMRWLRKAILRSAGVMGLHDEQAIFIRETNALRSDGTSVPSDLDIVAIATAFKAVVLEGLEVVFIVIATGAVGHMLVPASLGAAAAGVLVILLGLLIHKPLSLVPENILKFAVGVLLSAFGVFWVGEGLRFPWPGEDLSILGLVAGFLAVSALVVLMARRFAELTKRLGRDAQ